MEIVFGALSEPLTKQLKGKVYHRDAKAFQDAADAVVLLAVTGLINDSVKRAVQKRIVRKIEAAAERYASDQYA